MKNNDPLFWPGDEVDLSLRQQINQNYNDSINILQTQWYNADLAQRVTMGDQDIWGLIFPNVPAYSRKIFNFNIVNPIIQAVSGQQRQMRKSSVAIPVKKTGQKGADQFTKCLYHVHKDGLYQIYSTAFEQGALIQGCGFTYFYKSLAEDPISGDIKGRYVDMKSCLFDPYFRRYDMSDCRFWETRQFFDKQEAARYYSQFEDQILSLPNGSYRDDKFYYMPEVYQIQFPNLVAIDEYWYLSDREAIYLVDKETEECQEFRGKEEELNDILAYTRMVNDDQDKLRVIKKRKPTVRRTLLCNDKVMVDEPDPNKIDRYPIAASLGYFSPDTPYYAFKFKGMSKDLIDAQYLFNRFKVSNLDICESQQQGIKAKKGALVTAEDSLNRGHGRVLWINPNNQMSDVEPMQIFPPSPVMLQMEDMLMQIIHRMAGVDPNAMGIDVKDKAGVISMMRQAATARNLQRLFDQFDEYQQLCGDIIIGMIQTHWTYGKVMQVIGEEPVPEFDSKLFMKYSCKVIQGALTETQQQLELAQLLQLKEIDPEAVDTALIVEAMNIQNKDNVIKSITARQEAKSKQAQQMAELQMEQLRVDNETKLSYARSQDGLAMERKAKIQTDIAIAQDKLKKSAQEDTQALLNLVKAVKEIDGMGIEHLQAKLETLHRINELDFEGQKEKEEQVLSTNSSL